MVINLRSTKYQVKQLKLEQLTAADDEWPRIVTAAEDVLTGVGVLGVISSRARLARYGVEALARTDLEKLHTRNMNKNTKIDVLNKLIRVSEY